MRAAVYYGNHQLKIEDVPEPTAGAGQVKVRVSRNGICGTDLHEYFDGPIFIPPSEPHPLTGRNMPLVLGHEFSGTVTEVGAGVTGVREGDRVTIEPVYRCGECRPCRAGRYNLCQIVGFHGLMADGGMAEYTVVPRNQVHKLPDSVPLEMGALVEPMSVAYHAAVLGEVGDQGSALIFGAGPIGIGIWFALRGMGLTEIDVVEPSPVRRASIEALGARTLDPANQDVPALIAERTSGQGVDAAFDAAGVEQAVDSARSRATAAVMVGMLLLLVLAHRVRVATHLVGNADGCCARPCPMLRVNLVTFRDRPSISCHRKRPWASTTELGGAIAVWPLPWPARADSAS